MTLLTVRDVAKRLNVTEDWVRRHATKQRQPYLPCLRLGRGFRFDERMIDEWVRERMAA